ncbi:MAG: hypothetical protein JSS39_18355 [Nitrospira sp.]|nr:hypothetical protein [Nitrospira sp.]
MERLSFTTSYCWWHWGVSDMNRCMTAAAKEELDLRTYDPVQDHQKIAAYYSRLGVRNSALGAILIKT